MGESAESTVLTYNRKACDKKPDGLEYTILDCPTVIVEASNFLAQGITFENSAPKPDDLTTTLKHLLFAFRVITVRSMIAPSWVGRIPYMRIKGSTTTKILA